MFLAVLCVLVCGGSWSLVGLGWCVCGFVVLGGWWLVGAGGNCHAGRVVSTLCRSHTTALSSPIVPCYQATHSADHRNCPAPLHSADLHNCPIP